MGRQGSIIGVVTMLQAGWFGVLILAGARDFFLSRSSRLALGPTQPPIQWVLAFFYSIKWPRLEVDHSPPSSAEVKNE
jgi:hypothetical protein